MTTQATATIPFGAMRSEKVDPEGTYFVTDQVIGGPIENDGVTFYVVRSTFCGSSVTSHVDAERVAEMFCHGSGADLGRAEIFPFGSGPERKREGYKFLGTTRGTDDEVAERFSRDFRLVRGGQLGYSVSSQFLHPSQPYEFYVFG